MLDGGVFELNGGTALTFDDDVGGNTGIEPSVLHSPA